MKSTTKTMIPALLATAVISGAAVAADYDKPAPSWMDYRSTVSNMPIDRSYNDINVEKTKTDIDIEKTKTDNSVNDSNNTNTELNADVDVDKSRQMDDSYNTDASKTAKHSFNKRFDLNVDASQHTKDSNNTDASTNDSNNTDASVNDSYNTRKDLRFKAITEKMVVSPELNSKKKQYVGDSQQGSNKGYQAGPVQSGYLGGADIGGIGNDAPTYGTGWGSEHGYGGGDNRKSSNKQAIRLDGPNLGAVSNTSVVNQGRDLVFGPNRSALGNDFGGKQIISAGDQVQAQSNEAYKSGDNAANASDNITNSATKSSKIQ